MSQVSIVNPLDPNNYLSGPVRMDSPNYARMGSITNDTPFGSNGNTEFARAIYVGGTGNITIVKWDGTTQAFMSVPVGILPVCAIQVNSSGTSATNLVWLS